MSITQIVIRTDNRATAGAIIESANKLAANSIGQFEIEITFERDAAAIEATAPKKAKKQRKTKKVDAAKLNRQAAPESFVESLTGLENPAPKKRGRPSKKSAGTILPVDNLSGE